MSVNTNPSQYTEDIFGVDTKDFKGDINQKMTVPEKISFNPDSNGDNFNDWIGKNLIMNVPERILVAGQHQHVGTRAPPREIVFDNAVLSSEQYPLDLPRVASPPRTLTLDKYPFPNVDDYEEKEELEHTVQFKPNVDVHPSEQGLQISRREFTPPIAATSDGLTPAEEMIHLRRQLAKLNRRVMALELENMGRVQKEKFVIGFGIAYFLLKVIVWMNRN